MATIGVLLRNADEGRTSMAIRRERTLLGRRATENLLANVIEYARFAQTRSNDEQHGDRQHSLIGEAVEGVVERNHSRQGQHRCPGDKQQIGGRRVLHQGHEDPDYDGDRQPGFIAHRAFASPFGVGRVDGIRAPPARLRSRVALAAFRDSKNGPTR